VRVEAAVVRGLGNAEAPRAGKIRRRGSHRLDPALTPLRPDALDEELVVFVDRFERHHLETRVSGGGEQAEGTRSARRRRRTAPPVERLTVRSAESAS